MKVTLENTDPCSSVQQFEVDDLPAIVGRSAGAQVRLNDPMVSRLHCRLEDLNGTLLVRDLESMNGTYVNGSRTTERALLPGHRLGIGHTSFIVQYERGIADSSGAAHEIVCGRGLRSLPAGAP